MLKEAFEVVRDQMGPCGISCGLCNLGNGTIAGTAMKLKESLKFYAVPTWAPAVPGGSELNFDHLNRALDWISSNVVC